MQDVSQNDSNTKSDRTHFSIVGVVVRTRIKNKIIALVVLICLFSLISMSVVSYVTIKNMADYSADISSALAEGSASDAEDALVGQAHQFLLLLAKEQSRNCDSLLNTIKFNVELIESVTKDVFANPQQYSMDRPVIRASEATNAEFSSTYMLPSSVEMTPEIEREIGLLSNLGMLTSTMTDDSDIMEIYVGMESGLFFNHTKNIFDNPDYDPRERPWYAKAVENPGEVVFTDVYEDAFGTGMVLTAAKAVFDEQGELLGVAALDIMLQNLKNLALDMRIIDSGYVFIINEDGTYIVHPDMGTEGFIPNVNEREVDASVAECYRRMMAGETGFASASDAGDTFFITYSPISVSGWSIGVVVYEHELLSVLETFSIQMDLLADTARNNTTNMTGRALITFVIIFAIVSAMVSFLSMKLTYLVSNPIQRLTEEVVKIGDGNFEYRIPVESHDEIGFLTSAFNDMADSLYKYAQDIIELNKKKLELEVISSTDALTGILNRRCFVESASMRLEFAVRTNKPAYIVMFDLDHFKRVNDTYGHPAGDAVLMTVAETVGTFIRPNDLFARFGGEEFILAVTDITKESIISLVERIRQGICASPIVFNGQSIPVSASFGIAEVTSETGLDGAVALADEALYKAKHSGRNRSVFSE